MKSIFSPPLTGWHILAMLVAFFGVIFAVNGVFVYVAEKSFSGLETRHPFTKGLDYNQKIADAEMQRKRGWHVSLDQSDKSLTIKYLDREGNPVDGLAVTAALSRAATDRYDHRQSLKALGEGRYSLALDTLPLRGEWLVRIEAQQVNEKNYIVDQTIFVK